VKRRSIIWLSIAGLVFSVIIGIASLPDEVLIKSSSIDNSLTLPEEIIVPANEEIQGPISDTIDMKNIGAANSEIDALKKEISELKNEVMQVKTNSGIPVDIPEIDEVKDVAAEENSDEKSEGRIITISIKDGVGAKQR